MLGLLILLFLAAYLAISVWVTFVVLKWAKTHQRSGWWAVLTAFVMYNLVFWDFIPTLAAHKYYCETQAGFWVYKTPEEWMKENPGMKAGVDYKEQTTSDRKVEIIENGVRTTGSVNQRTVIKYLFEVVSIVPILDVTKHEESLFDSKDKSVLIKRIYFAAGHWGAAPKELSDYRFWANYPECKGSQGNSSETELIKTRNLYINLGEKIG